VFLAGCVEDLKVIRLKPDGSGTILYTRRMKDWASRPSGEQARNEFTRRSARADPEAGRGRVRSPSRKRNVAGWEGMTATYSFKDVTKLKIDDNDTVFGLAEASPTAISS
jgi:hypothetical protein